MSHYSESGRSMLEMIGVIALIVLLGMGALVGYQQTISSHQATTLHEDILVQAQSRKGQNYRGKTTYDSGIGKKTRTGLAMQTANNDDGETFSVIVKNVSSDMCKYLAKKDWKDAVRIKVDNNAYASNAIDCIPLKKSGNENFNLEVIFPKTKTSVNAFERTCDQCMSCEKCDVTRNICINNCPDSAQFCQSDRCVFSHCPKGKDLQNGNCVDCITNYACSSCAETSSTDVYWSGTDCMCYGDSCGQGFYCQASGTCASCPTNATCEEGEIVCNNDYYQVGETCEPCPANATCEGGVMECKEGYYGTNCENECLLEEHKIIENNTCVCDKENNYESDGANGCRPISLCPNFASETNVGLYKGGSFFVTSENQSIVCYCPTGYKYKNGACNTPITSSCNSWKTNECGAGYYCQFTPDTYLSDPTNGVCQDIAETGIITVANTDFSYRSNLTDWWTAQALCAAQGKHLVSMQETGCEIGQKTCSSETLTLIQNNVNDFHGFWTTDPGESAYRIWRIGVGSRYNSETWLRYGLGNYGVLCH